MLSKRHVDSSTGLFCAEKVEIRVSGLRASKGIHVLQVSAIATLFMSANIFAKYKSFTLSISLLQIVSKFTAQFDLQTCQIHNLLESWPRNCLDVYFKDFCTSPNMENVEWMNRALAIEFSFLMTVISLSSLCIVYSLEKKSICRHKQLQIMIDLKTLTTWLRNPYHRKVSRLLYE